jgi:HEPN domain-containing protein
LFGPAISFDERTSLLGNNETVARLDSILHQFFHRHDVDGNGVVEVLELKSLLAELGEYPNQHELETLMKEMDKNNNGVIEFKEFKESMHSYIKRQIEHDAPRSKSSNVSLKVNNISKDMTDSLIEEKEEVENEDEEEVPEDLQHLSPKQQRIRLVWRVCWMLLVGVVVLVLFSDPMVNVLSTFGSVIKIPSFYIAFVVAPFASNASEIIAAYNYAKKKTIRASSISGESVLGAACMNNTFCLCIFLGLVFCRNLGWEFSAETISILVVEVGMLVIALFRTQRLLYAFFALALYPISLGVVLILEYFGYN